MSRLDNYRGLCIKMEALKPTIANDSEKTADHHTEERILRLGELAAPIPGASRAFDWIGDGTEAIEAFLRLMVPLDRYHEGPQRHQAVASGRRLARPSDARAGRGLSKLALGAHPTMDNGRTDRRVG